MAAAPRHIVQMTDTSCRLKGATQSMTSSKEGHWASRGFPDALPSPQALVDDEPQRVAPIAQVASARGLLPAHPQSPSAPNPLYAHPMTVSRAALAAVTIDQIANDGAILRFSPLACWLRQDARSPDRWAGLAWNSQGSVSQESLDPRGCYGRTLRVRASTICVEQHPSMSASTASSNSAFCSAMSYSLFLPNSHA